MQQCADIYLLHSHSTCFGCIGLNTGTATSFQRGLTRPRWNEVAVPVL